MSQQGNDEPLTVPVCFEMPVSEIIAGFSLSTLYAIKERVSNEEFLKHLHTSGCTGRSR
jgi:hypothetical protein